MEKLRCLLKRYKDVLIYLIFGVLTTVVNYLVYYLLYNYLDLSATVSNIIAWAASVLFAFLTNKPFVFGSNDWSARTVWPEFWKFTLCRVSSGLLETAFIFLTVDLLHYGGNLMKLIVSIAVVIINYAASKLFVFKK